MRPAIFITAFLATLALRAETRLFPAPPLPPSDRYQVDVRIGEEWHRSHVHQDFARTSGGGAHDEPGRTFNWTTFITDAAVTVRVRRLGGATGGCRLRPSRQGLVAAEVAPDTVEFTIRPGQKISVEFGNEIKEWSYTGPPHGIPCVTHPLMIFADPLTGSSAIDGIPEEDLARILPGDHQETVAVAGGSPPRAGRCTLGDCGGKRIAVFTAGVHDIGYWQVPNSIDQIHIEPGAVVFGAIDVLPQGRGPLHDPATIEAVYRHGWSTEVLRSGFKLTGHGILSGARLPWHLKKDFGHSDRDEWWAHVRLVQLAAARVEVRDVTLVNAPYWTLSWINDADTRVTGTLDNFKIVGSWTYNNDGLPVPSGKDSAVTRAFIHANDDALKLYNSGSKVDEVVVWQGSNGAVFQFGWFPKSVRDLSVSDIDVIHFENWYGVNQSNRAVFNYADAAGPGTIESIDFRDITIEGKILRLFGFNTCGSKQVLRNFRFETLRVPDGMGAGQLGPPGRNYFLGDISGFRFVDFTIGTGTVLAAEQGAFDFGAGAGDGFSFRESVGTPGNSGR